MIDAQTIPDPGLPLADGYYLQHAHARLYALGIHTPEAFAARYGLDVRDLSAFGLLWIVDRAQGEHEMQLNALYRAGLPPFRNGSNAPNRKENAG